MSQQTLTYLKSKFETDDTPTEQDFIDVLDSFVHVSDPVWSTLGVNVKAAGYNAAGDGSADDTAAFTAANAALVSAGGGTIFVPQGTYRIASNIAFSNLVQLHFDKGAQVAPTTGVTLSNLELIAPPRARIFSGAGTVTLKAGSIHLPEWWGAARNGTTDDYAAFNQMRASLEGGGGGDVLFSTGTYVIGTSITFASSTRLHFAKNSILSMASGKTFALNGELVAPCAQIFAGAGTFTLTRQIEHLPEWWGAVHDGVTDDYAAVNKARVALEASGGGALMFTTGTYVIGTSITFAATVRVVLPQGALLSPNATKTVTVNGVLDAPPAQIFTGAGTIVLTSKVEHLPEWWGAVHDGVTDDSGAINKAITAVFAAGGGTVKLSNADYFIAASVNLVNVSGITLAGVGPGRSGVNTGTRLVTTANISLINVGSASATAVAEQNTIRDLWLSGNQTGAAQRGITFDGTGSFAAYQNVVENVRIVQMGDSGIRMVQRCWLNHFRQVWIQECATGVHVLNQANGVSFRDCIVNTNTNYGFNIGGTNTNFRIVSCDISYNGVAVNISALATYGLTIESCNLECNASLNPGYSHNIVSAGTAVSIKNNQIHNLSGSNDGIQVLGVTHEVSGNVFTGTMRYAVSLTGGSGSDHFIHHNNYAGTITQSVYIVSGTRMIVQDLATIAIGGIHSTAQSIGITIDQSTLDDSALVFRSTGDVAHGATAVIETAAWGAILKQEGDSGGMRLRGFKDADGVAGGAAVLEGFLGEAADTTTSAAGRAVVEVRAQVTDGSTGAAGIGTNGNLFGVRNSNNMEFLVDVEGDIHFDGTSNASAWDDHNDIALLETFRQITTGLDFRAQFATDIEYAKQILAETHVISLDENGRPFVSMKGLLGLVIDTLRQEAGRQRALDARLVALERLLLHP